MSRSGVLESLYCQGMFDQQGTRWGWGVHPSPKMFCLSICYTFISKCRNTGKEMGAYMCSGNITSGGCNHSFKLFLGGRFS